MEIEHKYLVKSDAFKACATAVRHIFQGYLVAQQGLTIRLRIADDQAFMTIKGPSADGGLSRREWEYAIPLAEAREIIPLCAHRTITKDRYLVPHEGHTWEVDVFHGRHEGLVLAELEVASANETFALPPWVGAEVTGDKRYYNAYMSEHHDTPLVEPCEEQAES